MLITGLSLYYTGAWDIIVSEIEAASNAVTSEVVQIEDSISFKVSKVERWYCLVANIFREAVDCEKTMKNITSSTLGTINTTTSALIL